MSSSKRIDRVPPVRAGLAVALLVALALPVVTAPSPAVAHSVLIESMPRDGAVLAEPPSEIRLRFNEDVSVVDDATELRDQDGTARTIDSASVGEVVTITPTTLLPAGEYVLTYRVVSADSHPIGGSLSFEVEASVVESPTTAPTPDATTDDDPVPAGDGADGADEDSGGASLTVVVLAGLAGLVVGLFLYLRRRA